MNMTSGEMMVWSASYSQLRFQGESVSMASQYASDEVRKLRSWAAVQDVPSVNLVTQQGDIFMVKHMLGLEFKNGRWSVIESAQ